MWDETIESNWAARIGRSFSRTKLMLVREVLLTAEARWWLTFTALNSSSPLTDQHKDR